MFQHCIEGNYKLFKWFFCILCIQIKIEWTNGHIHTNLKRKRRIIFFQYVHTCVLCAYVQRHSTSKLNTVDSWNIPIFPTRDSCCISILFFLSSSSFYWNQSLVIVQKGEKNALSFSFHSYFWKNRNDIHGRQIFLDFFFLKM